MNQYDTGATPELDYRRLWAGGAATAVVAALVAVVGLLIARGIFDVAVLAPKGRGIWGNANTITYAVISAAVALAATGLMHLLSVATPAPNQFFGWIMALFTVIALVLPLTLAVELGSKVATALINLAIGFTIGVLVSSTASSARRMRRRPDQSGDYRDTQQWGGDPPTRYYPR
jgi:hypothetical protein